MQLCSMQCSGFKTTIQYSSMLLAADVRGWVPVVENFPHVGKFATIFCYKYYNMYNYARVTQVVMHRSLGKQI